MNRSIGTNDFSRYGVDASRLRSLEFCTSRAGAARGEAGSEFLGAAAFSDENGDADPRCESAIERSPGQRRCERESKHWSGVPAQVSTLTASHRMRTRMSITTD